MKDFTMIPNRLLDSPNGLAPAEKAVLFCIYRMTMGYTQRRSCKISQSTLKIMSGVAGIGRVCGLLVDKGEIKMDDVAGKSHIFTIPEPGTSFNELDTKPSTSVTTTPNMSSSPLEHEVVGSRGAIYNIKDNFKESTLSNELIEEMKSKYPDKDIDQAQKSFLIYPHHQGKNWSAVVWAEKFEKWCASEKPSHKKFIAQFKLDGGGANYVGYCAECRVSDFYAENELMGDSRCCNAKILPAKPT